MKKILSLILLFPVSLFPAYTYNVLQENRAPADAQLPTLEVALKEQGNYTIILTLLKKAQLLDALNNSYGYTFFFPQDKAFSDFEKGVGHEQFMLLVDNSTDLNALIDRMIIPHAYTIKELKHLPQLMSINKVLLGILPHSGTVMLNSYSTVVDQDIRTRNGIIQGVNMLVLP
jgi:uncharacterized surface protein with fasciclin (FAS1) repeats